MEKSTLSLKSIFIFWYPLAATWLMMAIEGPFVAAIIARLPEAKNNLAAYGVTFSFALVTEAPVMMLTSAAVKLVTDRESFLKLRRFTHVLCTAITLLMAIFLLPPIFSTVAMDWIGLPAEVANLTHIATVILLPWPGAIGYRRFYQGILIHRNLTRRVAYGTMIRLSSMAATAGMLYTFVHLPGVSVGVIALATGVTMEALASRVMSLGAVREILHEANKKPTASAALTYRGIAKFYIPLALTSMLALGVYPMVTFFVGQSRMALESLAIFPVINALVFIFRSIGLSYQEVAIALMGEAYEGLRLLRRFAILLAGVLVLGLASIVFTPLATVWFYHISGLSLELTRLALTPGQILAVIPGLSVVLSLQRAIMVSARHTTPITVATAVEVTGIMVTLFVAIRIFDVVGAVAAATALLCGRVGTNLLLALANWRVLHRFRQFAASGS